MVRRVIWLLVLSLACENVAPAALSPPTDLVLSWKGLKTRSCQKLIESFLSELRSLASDRRIQLEAAEDAVPNQSAAQAPAGDTHPQQKLELECGGRYGSPETLTVASQHDRIELRYFSKAGGFDASDWLLFQQKYLRPTANEISLAPTSVTEPQGTRNLAQLPANPALATSVASVPNDAGSSIFGKWWFWTIVAAGLGAGAYGLVRATSGGNDSSGRINVEIH